MLQQTRVSVVIPYFKRFMARFPDISLLAAAEQDEVLHLWSGLGYYARARNLHAAAKAIVADHSGRFPTEIEQVQALPGIGPSTAGAVLSLSLDQRHAILDGNAKRVLSRCFAVPGWPGRNAVLKRLWEIADACTPLERVSSYNQAMMDLGATLCTRSSPDCGRCPLARGCEARGSGNPTAYPEPKPHRTIPVRRLQMLVVCNPTGEVLLERRPPTGIWGGLWSLPECGSGENAANWCSDRLGVLPRRVEKLPVRRHTFTHFHLDISPLFIELGYEREIISDGERSIWCDPLRPRTLGIAAPIARILRDIVDMQTHKKGEFK
jgi:A/G-specific adenine glycosylase